MKKIIVLLIVISNFSYSVGFAVGKEFISGGFLKIKDSPSDANIDISDSLGLYMEVYKGELDIAGIPAAAGVGLKFNSYSDDATDDGVGTVATLYGIGKFEWDLSSIKPYAQLRFGYPYVSEGKYLIDYKDPLDTNFNDLAGVYYLSLGLGLSAYHVDASVNYDYNTYILKSRGFDDKNVSSGQMSIKVGLKF